jgi:hypothetical protein
MYLFASMFDQVFFKFAPLWINFYSSFLFERSKKKK